jgi:copper resistance protein B
MRVLLLLACLASAPVLAQHAGHEGHDSHEAHEGQAGASAAANVPAPPSPSDHAADAVHDPSVMAAAREQLYAEGGGMRSGTFAIELAELRSDSDGSSWRLEGQGWYGGDDNRVLLRFDGASDDSDRLEHARIEGLYWRAIAPWWNLVAGLRWDPRPEPSRSFLAVGATGLAPYGIELATTAYLSDEGEVEARIEAHRNLQLTRRWVLESRVTLDLSLSDVPERHIGEGIPNLEIGLRLRWEHNRRFVPYLGAEWQASFGDTAQYVAARGEDPRRLRFVAGLSAWL